MACSPLCALAPCSGRTSGGWQGDREGLERERERRKQVRITIRRVAVASRSFDTVTPRERHADGSAAVIRTGVVTSSVNRKATA